MNFVTKLSVVALAALSFASCKNTNAEPAGEGTKADTTETKTTAANLETASFKIDGMMCPQGCAATIEKKLAKMDGVEKAKVDFDSKTATIEFDATKQTVETFAQTVEKMGEYKVSDLKSSGDKAMVYQQEPRKKDTKKTTTSTASTSKNKKESKPATCSGHEKGGSCCSDKKDTKGGKM
ncbi:heavy-metal-associated domain-containing protein [Flavobacterium akiainvivens]|uniref:heavy-metal-associated domain-containing protein n=1 Tax=Flavobacterium akiainvivens TaxID=1202724 RepID=UPI0006C8D807|nr:heavy metal-associated domain-containing protein [Flavobacterium akiainvivens]SFQ70974.1 Heavy-metal-associated domain-containing protein [Flavobacterium akiainvivens]